MGQCVVEKILQTHMVSGPARDLKAGDFVSVRPDHVMTHDNTSAVLNKFKAIGATKVFDPKQPVFALDHDIQNKSESNLKKYATIEAFAKEQGIRFYPAGSGIGHQMMLENGHVLPGSLVVASDSHSNMYGALGALGTPIVRTDAAAIWATGEFWWSIPRTIRVNLKGKLRPGVSGKDVIIALCGLYNQGEALNAAIEFTGDGLAHLSMDARMTISNMTTEWGALTGFFPVDEITINFLKERLERMGAKAPYNADDIKRWEREALKADADAHYAASIELDLNQLTPHIAGPDVVQRMTPLAQMAKEKIAIHKAYLLSCVNSRYDDLKEAAEVLKGKKIADGVTLLVAAASQEIEDRAKADGFWAIFEAAGADFLPPSCGPCIGLGTGLLEEGEVGISATNRNFKGRMGSRDAKAYLASPTVVAASAIAGFITDGQDWSDIKLANTYQVNNAIAAADESVEGEILDGFPSTAKGRLVYVPADNLNTDGIYANKYTYREDVTQEEMAKVLMENYDPEFSAKTRANDIVISGFNFGTGSSREQAATAFKAKGISMVIAASFSQTYLRNAYNNGFICLELPALSEALAQRFEKEVNAGDKTIIAQEEVSVDFSKGILNFAGETYHFEPLGVVQQGLVIAGGIENQVKIKLGLN